jgi:hypothetical protein
MLPHNGEGVEDGGGRLLSRDGRPTVQDVRKNYSLHVSICRATRVIQKVSAELCDLLCDFFYRRDFHHMVAVKHILKHSHIRNICKF